MIAGVIILANRESWLQEVDQMDAITIRFSEADREQVLGLAELDGRAAPRDEALLAEIDGRLVAAGGVVDGAAVSDPFVLSAEVLDLLRLRAEQERERALGRGPLLGRLMLIRQRAGVIA
jgi:hypothetical protein